MLGGENRDGDAHRCLAIEGWQMKGILRGVWCWVALETWVMEIRAFLAYYNTVQSSSLLSFKPLHPSTPQSVTATDLSDHLT
jgi:hypothetical protein